MSNLLMGVFHIELRLYRHAAGPRGVGRAGEIWRLCQEAAVAASAAVGWPAQRFVETGAAFVVTGMAVTHHAEAAYGEPLAARTWVHDFRRQILSRREVRLDGPHGPVASASQQWAHIGADRRPARASPEVVAAFPPIETGEAPVLLPTWTAQPGQRVHRFPFSVWHTWMDPLAHVNHPMYVDWCDEATSQVLAAAGLDPQRLVPVAERVDWRNGAVAGDEIALSTRVVGVTAAGDAVLEHHVADASDPETLYAQAVTVRRLVGETGEAILAAMG